MATHAVPRDAKKPCAKSGGIVQLRQRAKDADPDFLEQILGVLVSFVQHFSDVEPQAWRVEPQQLREGRVVADLAADDERQLIRMLKVVRHA